ncbi:MAG: restriction endonuclease subunit S, partial [Candidatus Woesebacteria bacterium]|nr:restriction endonuclease subunit S [Candidatus Woesebacteria bacterium]
KKFELVKSDFLVAMTGATSGKVAILNDNGRTYYLNQRVGKFYVKNENKLTKKFLYYSVLSPGNKHLLKKLADGSAQGNMSSTQIEDLLELYLPNSIGKQNEIASILSTFDDKIEVNNKISKTLEEMAQAIFKEWFIKNKDKLQTQKVKDMGRVVTGKTPSTKDLLNFGSDYPFVTIPDMTNTFVLNTERHLSQKSADRMGSLLLPVGSVCVSCIATVGLVSITTEESITNQQINSIIPNNKEYTYFLYQFFKRNKGLLEAFGAGGSTTLIINKSQFENLEIVVPNDSTMQKFHQLVEPMYKKILTISKENQKLATMRDLLLPKLMKGEIRV